jgi:hypothetical protein
MLNVVRAVDERSGGSQPAVAEPPKSRRVRAAISTRGRVAMAKLLADATDEELERRFGSPLSQRALFTVMTRSFQPRLAVGFRGEIAVELTHSGENDPQRVSHWWTIEIDSPRAIARHRTPRDPMVTIHSSVPDFIRMFSGMVNPVTMFMEGRVLCTGDVSTAPRLIEMFGGVDPDEVPVEIPGAG